MVLETQNPRNNNQVLPEGGGNRTKRAPGSLPSLPTGKVSTLEKEAFIAELVSRHKGSTPIGISPSPLTWAEAQTLITSGRTVESLSKLGRSEAMMAVYREHIARVRVLTHARSTACLWVHMLEHVLSVVCHPPCALRYLLMPCLTYRLWRTAWFTLHLHSSVGAKHPLLLSCARPNTLAVAACLHPHRAPHVRQVRNEYASMSDFIKITVFNTEFHYLGEQLPSSCA